MKLPAVAGKRRSRCDYATNSGEVRSRMSVPFRERNPVIIGAVSLAVIAAFILAAFKADRTCR